MSSEDPIYLCRCGNGKLTGEGFVRFADKESIVRALGKDKQNMGSRYIEVYPSSEVELKRTKQRTGEPTSEHSIIMRLRGLPFSTNEEDIVRFFSKNPLIRLVQCWPFTKPLWVLAISKSSEVPSRR